MGPCYQGIARPQVADGGTAFNMEGSCEYVEEAVADIRQGVVLQLWGLGELLTTHHRKKYLVSKRLNRSTCE